jgi:hypothetical protein
VEVIAAGRAASGPQAARLDSYTLRKRIAKLIVATEWFVLLAGMTYLCGRTLPRAWQHLNTDFPSYYVAARLLHERYNTDGLYEWIWIQRQKDHFAIDYPLVGFAPNPPFAAFAVLPLTYWQPLTAKRIWIIANLAFLVIIAVLLRSLTGMIWRRIALLMVLSFPLHRNLLYGQYCILLLLLMTAAFWLYVKHKRTVAGILVGIGFGIKIFPALFLLYFLRKKDYRAALGLITGCLVTVLLGVAAFGLELNRIYFVRVLPWSLHGEGGLDPFNLAANSVSALLHHLFIFEPEWNPHPLLHLPALVAVLLPLVQIVLIAPAILLVVPEDVRPRRVLLECSAFIVGLLAISTRPASYHFILLILPLTIMTAILIEGKRFASLALLLGIYLGIGFPLWNSTFSGGLPFLAVPRLYLLIGLCLFFYISLRQQELSTAQDRRQRWLWSGVLACIFVLQVADGLRHLHGVYTRESERILTLPSVFLATEPVATGTSVLSVAMLQDGYHTADHGSNGAYFSADGADQLALTAAAGRVWVEESAQKSRIISVGPRLAAQRLEVDNAEFPVASSDGRWLSYLRSDHGRSQIWLHALEAPAVDWPITPSGLNVLEMSFLPDNSVVFAAAEDHGAPHLFVTDRNGDLRQLTAYEARFPAVSPDGEWLAHSRQAAGVWNLWLKNMRTGEARHIRDANCNDVSPSWEADSKTLLFASDCGRGFGLTALYRRRVLP